MKNKVEVLELSLIQKISLWSAAVALTVLAMLHVLKPELNPLWQFISEYSLGKFGFFMNLVFFSLSISLFSFGFTLMKKADKVTTKISIGLVFISSIGMLLGGIFNTDPSGTPMDSLSFSGTMHNIGGQLNLTPFVALFAAIGLRKHLNKKKFVIQWIIVAVQFIFVVGFILTAASSQGVFGEGVYTAVFGRLMILTYFVWQIYISTNLSEVKH